MRFALATVATVATVAVLASGGTAIALAAAPLPTSASSPVSAKTAAQIGDAALASAGITRAKAITIAKRRVPGARVTKVEREWEHGQRTWKVELRKGGREYEVYVSIRTGKVIKFRSHHDD
jgi:uncharacterized membrane protein YkoI